MLRADRDVVKGAQEAGKGTSRIVAKRCRRERERLQAESVLIVRNRDVFVRSFTAIATVTTLAATSVFHIPWVDLLPSSIIQPPKPFHSSFGRLTSPEDCSFAVVRQEAGLKELSESCQSHADLVENLTDLP